MPDACELSWLTGWEPDGLAQLATAMLKAESRGDPFSLDLSDEGLAGSAQPSAVRLHIPAVLAIANLLVGRHRDLPLRVRLPESRGLNLQLARGGVFFALSNRCGVSWSDGPPVLGAGCWTLDPALPSERRRHVPQSSRHDA